MAADDKNLSGEALQSSPQLNGISSEAATFPELTVNKQAAALSVTKYLRKGKEQEWNAYANRTRPLTLLELPFDILSLIVKEITHTNDLTALALANSQLHDLAMPHIYARFDIVWPDGHVTASEPKSVDALTYGLSTLCLGSSFARTTRRFMTNGAPLSRFKGNDYAKYTRKFSLGNGPNDWVAEYMITKESGKMLGTLVALAISKMENLEAFVWDMPTGVLSDIFMALASLDEPGSRDCKLDRVWIRWHDNSDGMSLSPSSTASPVPPVPSSVPMGSTLTPIGIMLPANATHPAPKPTVSYSEHFVEYPTFSVLPPLKSLTVLEIDELAYLDEMAVLIERSKDRLQELRVGIAAKASDRDFVQTWDGSGLRQIDHKARWPGESSIGDRRLGGVLGVLVGKIYDIRKRKSAKGTAVDSPTPSVTGDSPSPATAAAAQEPHGDGAVSPEDSTTTLVIPPLNISPAPSKRDAKTSSSRSKSKSSSNTRKRLDGKLKLHTLELERVPLSMQVCRHAIDWSVLTNLTILDCAQDENLWKMLKRQFQPTAMSSPFGISATSRPSPNAPLEYHLTLKKIHADHTSTSLISFIKETLAPNSLETLFLQDRRRQSTGPPPVTIDMIFKGAIKRHRSSLRRLLLDSSQKVNTESATRWRHWVLTTEILEYVTSGRMSNLRELAVALAYKDWHTFLQRLPNMPQLRSVNIPHIVNHVVGTVEPKELALQIADIITLRPEVQLCYVGISTKCFELLETQEGAPGASMNGSGPVDPVLNSESQANGNDSSSSSDDDGLGEDTSDDDLVDVDPATESDAGAHDTPASPTDPDETQSDNDGDEDDSDSDSDDGFVEPDRGKVKLRLREILFYDDKVAIFKARHGKL